jgi:tetratricopeptide (TPR) repeat protein
VRAAAKDRTSFAAASRSAIRRDRSIFQRTHWRFLLPGLVGLFGLWTLIDPIAAEAHAGPEHDIEVLSKAIQGKPQEARLYIERGSVYSDDGQLEPALEDLNRAEVLGDRLAVAHAQGVLHYRMQKYEAARAYLDAYLARVPGHTPSLEYRARVLRELGLHQAALADLNAYLALQKQPNPGIYISAAQTAKEIEGAGIPEALAILDRGMENLGTIPQLQQPAIELELERRAVDNAIERLNSLKPSLGASPDWSVDMGELQMLAGRPEQAEQLFEAASNQIASLRKTVARRELQVRIDALRVEMSDDAAKRETLEN